MLNSTLKVYISDLLNNKYEQKIYQKKFKRYKKYYPINTNILVNSLNVLKWKYKYNYHFDDYIIDTAAINGNFDIVKWLYYNVDNMKCSLFIGLLIKDKNIKDFLIDNNLIDEQYEFLVSLGFIALSYYAMDKIGLCAELSKLGIKNDAVILHLVEIMMNK